MAAPVIADIDVSGASSTSPISHTIPAGWSVGDLVIARVVTTNRTVSSTTFPGTQEGFLGSITGDRCYIYSRILQAGDLGASFSWTLNANPSNPIIVYLRITGADGTTPLDDIQVNESGTATTSQVSPSVTTEGVDRLILRVSANGGQAFTASSGDTGTKYTNRTASPGYEIWYSSLASAGTTGTATYTIGTARAQNHFTLAIAPASGPAGLAIPLVVHHMRQQGMA